MDQMKLHIDMVAASREKEVVSTKEGYLLHVNERHRVKSKWMRSWYVLRDGLFYCKSGKVSQPAPIHSFVHCHGNNLPDRVQDVDNDSILDIVLCTVRIPAPRSRSGVGLKESTKHKFEIMTPGFLSQQLRDLMYHGYLLLELLSSQVRRSLLSLQLRRKGNGKSG